MDITKAIYEEIRKHLEFYKEGQPYREKQQ